MYQIAEALLRFSQLRFCGAEKKKFLLSTILSAVDLMNHFVDWL